MSIIRNTAAMSVELELNFQIHELQNKRRKHALEIERIDQKISELNTKRKAIHNTQLAVLNLPAEARIHTEAISVASFRTRLSEVVISHVCKRWRNITLNYPHMWTRFFYWVQRENKVPLELFALYLERSGTQNLDLFFEFGDYYGVYTTVDLQLALLDMALAHLVRWKSVTLKSKQGFPFTQPLLGLSGASASNLEYLSLCPHSDEMENAWVDVLSLEPTIFRAGAPKLSYVKIGGSRNFIPPLSNLTTLRIEKSRMSDLSIGWLEMIAILSIPTLINVSMAGDCYFYPPEPLERLPLIIMNNLKHFRIGGNEIITLLLTRLRAPRLETLSLFDIMFLKISGIRPHTELYFFPSFRTLTLTNVMELTSREAHYLTELTQVAKAVNLFADDHSSSLLASLIPDVVEKECWPNLETLVVDLGPATNLMPLYKLAASHRPTKFLRVRMFEWQEQHWRRCDSAQFAQLEAICVIDILLEFEEFRPLRRPVWPPAGGYSSYPNHYDDYY